MVSQQEYFQLIYISAAVPGFDEHELPELLAVARENNKALSITGMLLYHNRSFIQVLTGPKESVESLFAKIECDPRHTNTRILYRGAVSGRSFNDLSMGFYNSSKSKDEIPGLNDVLKSGISVDEEESKTKAIEVLEAFRDGKWRQAVNT